MINHNSVTKEKPINEFRKKETLRTASPEMSSVELKKQHAHQKNPKRLQIESSHSKEQIEILYSRLIQRADELEDDNIKLKQVSRELETLNITVSHDLRMPLSAICLYSQAVLRHCGDVLDKQCQAYLESISSQTEYMNRILNRLMEFSLASCKEIQKERVDLSNIVNKIAANLKLSGQERSVDFNITAEIVVNGDKYLLQEVLENLIGNAWKYTGMKESAVIEFGVTKHDGKPAYFIRDNGIGFDMNQTAKLFSTFQRLNCTDEFKGYGIGLASVKRIVQRHGGGVWAEGEVGKGATFYFTL